MRIRGKPRKGPFYRHKSSQEQYTGRWRRPQESTTVASLFLELERAANGSGCSVISRRSELQFALHDAEISLMHMPAATALLLEPAPWDLQPFAIRDVVIALAHTRITSPRNWT